MSRARRTMLSSSGPANMPGKSVSTSIFMLVASESPGRRADQISRQMLALDQIPSREILARRIEAVDRKALIQALKTLKASPPTFVILGPQGRLLDKSQLKARFSPDFATKL